MDSDDLDYKRLIEPIEVRMIQSVWRIVQDPDDAEDALQEALAMVWKRLNRVRRHPNPQALILRMCVNAAYDVLRRQARIRRREALGAIPESAADPGPSALEEASGRQERSEILKAIRILPRDQAQAVLMRFVQDLSYRDIAEALGRREATARSLVLRARTRLAKLLAHLAPTAEGRRENAPRK